MHSNFHSASSSTSELKGVGCVEATRSKFIEVSLVAEPLQNKHAPKQIKFLSLLIIMVGLSGLEPPTSRLSGVRSNQLSYGPFGAGEGNRTLATSLEGWSSTIELHPHYFYGREDRIRTCDPLVPNQMRYQAALLPEMACPERLELPTF